MEGYLRFIYQLLSKFSRDLKNVVTGIPAFLGRPRTEVYVGRCGVASGIIAILGSLWWNRPSDYIDLFGKTYLLGLRDLQWGLIVLVGFFLLTHGIYRADKEAEEEKE